MDSQIVVCKTHASGPGKLLESPYAPLAFGVLLLLLTHSRLMGDTLGYANTALQFTRSSWEFGHLIWVPIGWVAHALFGADKLAVIQVFMAISALSALAAILLARACLVRIGLAAPAANLAAIALALAQAMVNFSQTGSSYIPGLAFLFAALYFMLGAAEDRSRLWPVLLAALSLAMSAAFWFPYILAAPAITLTPVVLRGWNRLGQAVIFGFCFTLALAILFGSAAWSVGVRDLPSFLRWMAASSHDERRRQAGRGVPTLLPVAG